MNAKLSLFRLCLETLGIVIAAEVLVVGLLALLGLGSTSPVDAAWHAALLTVLAGPLVLWRCVATVRRTVREAQAPEGSAAGAPPLVLTAVVLTLGLAATLSVAQWQQHTLQSAAEARFGRHKERLQDEVRRRFQQVVDGLMGARGVFAASAHVDRAAWRAYVQSRDLPSEFPGVRGFGFIERVSRPALASFVAAERQDGQPDFEVRSSGSAPSLYVIRYIEPLADNREALGFDIGSEAVRRQAIEHAIQTGRPTLSARITLLQDAQQRPGFIYMLPVYRRGSATATAQERDAALLGIVYAPIVTAELLAGAVESVRALVDLDMFDGGEAAEHRVFSTGEATAPSISDRLMRGPMAQTLSARDVAEIGGREFAFRVVPSTAFWRNQVRWTPSLLRVAGTFATLLLALTVWLLASGQVHARALAQSMTSDLERLAQVVRHTSNAVVITDKDRVISWVNPGFVRFYGYSLEEAVGSTPARLLRSGRTDAATLRTIDDEGAASRGCRVEVINRGKDGGEHWVDLEIQPRRDARGQLIGYMEIGQDITERKLAEERLRANKAFLDRAEQIAGVGGWEVDLRTDALTWSEQTFRIHNVKLGQQPPLSAAFAHFAPPERALIERTAQACIRNRQPWDLELPLTDATGEQIWIRSVGAVEIEADRPIRLVGTIQDITPARRMREELRRSNAVLRSILDNLPCGLSVFNGDLRLAAHNAAYRDLLDLPHDLVEGAAPSFEAIMRHNAARGDYGPGQVDDIVARLVATAQHPTHMLHERQTHDGKSLEVRSAPMPGGGFVTTYMDITERKKMERLKSEFISTVTHELRTPLTSIYGSLSLLASGAAGPLPDAIAELVSLSFQSSERLVRLINDVLDVERIEARLMHYAMSVQPLAPLVAQAIDATRAYADQHGVRFEFASRIESVCVLADVDRIVQVVINLLSNAVKFSGPSRRVCVRMTELRDQVRVGVTDDGPGIPAEFRSRIFERFSQADSSDRRQKGGTGLGLNICRSIVTEHRGHIDYDSQPGHGSTFYFDLPVAERR